MSASRLSHSWGPARIECDADGQLTSVVHEQDPGLSYLSGGRVRGLLLNGRPLADVAPDVQFDVDELEITTTYPGRLRVVVRHAFAAGWGMRITFANLAEATARVEGARLDLRPGSGCVAWALVLGLTSAYAIAPASGTGPVLGGLLRLGSLDRATVDGLEVGSFDLRPDGRYVVQLHWDWYETPRAFDQERYGDAPSALFATVGEPVQVPVNEDVAVVAPDEVRATREGDRLELVSEDSGRFPCELRSARGTTAFALQWVAPINDVLVAAAGQAMRGRRTTAGVVKLADVAEALVVQRALALNGLDADEAGDALDLFTARLVAAPDASPLSAAYLSREFDRLGDRDLLAAATNTVLCQPRPAPGVGIAATQLCLGLIVSGQSVSAVLGHLSFLAAQSAHSPASDAPTVRDEASALELVAVTDAGPGAAGGLTPAADQRRRIAALGLHLGGGLKGHAVRPLSLAERSHLINVFQLLPDGLSSSMASLWGCSAATLARRATPELLAQLESTPVTDAHAWLVLALHGS